MCSVPAAPPRPAPPPDPADASIRDAAAAERRRLQGTAGRRSTFLSGIMGDASAMPVSGGNSLLGK